VRIEENKQLAPLTTLGIGGPARWFIQAQTEADIAEAAAWARERELPLFVLGGGSNLLVSDAGFDGLVLQIALKGILVRESTAESDKSLYEAAAGEDWDHFVQRTADDNCAGLECLAGIPGTVGGTPVQNVGAYGQEVASTIERVRAFDLAQQIFVVFNSEECGFAYRRSRFNSIDRGRYIVTRVLFALKPDAGPSLKYADLQRAFPPDSTPSLNEVAAAIRRIRHSKGMLLVEGDPDCRSAGSFFKNPIVTESQADSIAHVAGSEPPRFSAGPDHPTMVKLPAAWLIEKAGFAKGYALGRAAISTKHTLALINLGGATSADILALAANIRSAVAGRFAIQFEMEPVMLGFNR
jgi:UDP-N-acetylmuramate dehydrogenase